MLQAGPVKIDCGLYDHHGQHDGAGFVIHNSKRHGAVVRESLQAFADGRDVVLSDVRCDNPQLATENALKYLGMSYDLFTANCEHFVRLCNGVEVESPQVQKYMCVGAGLTITANTNNNTAKLSGVAMALAAYMTPPDRSPIPNSLAAFVAVVGLSLILQ